MPSAFSIPITGLAANDPVPGTYLDLQFAQGAASLGSATYAIILLGNKTAAAPATVDTTVYGPTSATPLISTADAIALFGQGSELHRMWLRVLRVNKGTPVYAVAVTESVGAAATLAITMASAATANTTVRIFVGDDFADSAITTGDTAIVIAGNMASAINSKLDWGVTAANGGTAVCTITCKQKGLRGNWFRGAAVVASSTAGTTSSVVAPTFFTGGTTADSSTTALATVLPYRYYYIVSAAEDATQLGALVTQVNTQAQPLTGIRQRVFGGSVDTSGNVTTIATGLNAARAEITWSQNSEVTPSELAANAAAIYALEEAPLVFKCNFAGYGNDAVTVNNWTIKAPRSGTAQTRATIKAALNNGISPIGVNANGTTYLVNRITTRSLSGANADYRIRDAHKVTICDRYADDLNAKFSAQFTGKLLADDPPVGTRVPGGNVATPRVIRACINKLTLDYASLDLLQNPDQIVAATIVIRESSPTTRASCRIPLQTADGLFQLGAAIDQVG